MIYKVSVLIVVSLALWESIAEANPAYGNQFGGGGGNKGFGGGGYTGHEAIRDYSQPAANSFAMPGAPPMPGGAFIGGSGGFKSNSGSSGIGNVIANARGEGGNVASNAVSSRGGNVLSNSIGGERASALSMTGGSGNSQANSKSWGAGGSKANSFA